MEHSKRELAMMKAMERMKSIHFWEICPEIPRGEAILLGTICSGTEENKHLPVSELNKMTRMHPAAISRLMSSMEKKGFIVRSFAPDNHRNILVRVTETGYELNSKVRNNVHSYWKQVLALTPQNDVDEMLRILDEMMDNMEIVLKQQVEKIE